MTRTVAEAFAVPPHAALENTAKAAKTTPLSELKSLPTDEVTAPTDLLLSKAVFPRHWPDFMRKSIDAPHALPRVHPALSRLTRVLCGQPRAISG